MTKRDILVARLEMASHNLLCYSANYAMTQAKPGMEMEWAECLEEVNLLEKWILELVADTTKIDLFTSLLARAAEALREYGDDPRAVIDEIKVAIGYTIN